MAFDRNPPSGPLVRQLLRVSAAGLADVAAESEIMAAADCPFLGGSAVVIAPGATFPAAMTPDIRARAAVMETRGAVVSVRVQHRAAGTAPGNITYAVAKISVNQATLAQLFEPDGTTPLVAIVPADSIVPVQRSVTPSGFAAFAAGEQLVLIAIHPLLTAPTPTDISAEIEFVQTGA